MATACQRRVGGEFHHRVVREADQKVAVEPSRVAGTTTKTAIPNSICAGSVSAAVRTIGSMWKAPKLSRHALFKIM